MVDHATFSSDISRRGETISNAVEDVSLPEVCRWTAVASFPEYCRARDIHYVFSNDAPSISARTPLMFACVPQLSPLLVPSILLDTSLFFSASRMTVYATILNTWTTRQTFRFMPGAEISSTHSRAPHWGCTTT